MTWREYYLQVSGKSYHIIFLLNSSGIDKKCCDLIYFLHNSRADTGFSQQEVKLLQKSRIKFTVVPFLDSQLTKYNKCNYFLKIFINPTTTLISISNKK